MLIFSLAFLFQAPKPPITPARLFDLAVAAEKARGPFAVDVAVDTLFNKVAATSRYRLECQPPSNVLLVKMDRGKAALAFWLRGGKLTACDPNAREVAIRKAPTSGGLDNRLAAVIGAGLDDAISVQLNPITLQGFFAPFKKLQGWSIAGENGATILRRTVTIQGGRSETLFEFRPDHQLRKVLLVGPDSKLQWTYAHLPPPKKVAYVPPPGSVTVDSLSERPSLPNVDASAKPAIEASLKAYARLDSVAFSVHGPDGATQAWMSGSSFKEIQSRWTWTYAGGTLTVKDGKTGRAYRGACKPAQVSTYLKTIRAPMEPILQGLLVHRNPLMRWIQAVEKVERAGSLTLAGAPADIIEMTGADLRVTLLIRRDNHLIASVSSQTLENGRAISGAQRDFTYLSLGKPISASVFALSVAKPAPLSALGR